MEIKLTIELVPQTCWYTNVRSQVSRDQWDKLRRNIYRQANYRCQVCGGRGSKHPVECHEIFSYDDTTSIQKLVRLIALCPSCHEVKHIGLAGVKGREQIAIAHLAKVNKWSIGLAEEYVEHCFKVWRDRSRVDWELDLSYLDE